jgi:hypothetical protein
MLAMYDYVLNFARAFDRKQKLFLFGDKLSCIQENQRQKKSARRVAKIGWPDRLLFMAIAGCILSASGIIPNALSSVAVAFLIVCSLVLTGIMLFWLLCPVSITGILAMLRFSAKGAAEKSGQAQKAGSSYVAISNGKIVP